MTDSIIFKRFIGTINDRGFKKVSESKFNLDTEICPAIVAETHGNPVKVIFLAENDNRKCKEK